MNNIHSTAIISPGAVLGDNVTVGAFASVEGAAKIGDGSIIEPYARVLSGARIGKNCRICSFAIVAGAPQDLHFDQNLQTYAQIGDGTVIREHATVHRATFEGKSTVIGSNCLIMCSGHVGHDCIIGDNVIIASFAAVAGHCQIADNTFVSGGVMIHQRVRIGEGVMLSGNSATSLDIPPYTTTYGRNMMGALNLIGMNRRGIPRESIAEVKHLFSKVYETLSVRKNALELLEQGAAKTPEGKKFLEFFTVPNRHYMTRRQES